jgi:ribonucleoside-diphosphate reductase alpha chain
MKEQEAKFTRKSKLTEDVRQAILNLEVMPSMRALMTAGPALERDNVAGYNCAYVACDDARVFDEILYILMCGTGVGFSVERKYIEQLPEVAESLHEANTVISVPDSKIGWASSFRQLISLLYMGQIPKWDLSKVRPAGAVLRTFGGRSSGPAPLDALFKYTIKLFQNAAGRKLHSIEAHDLICKIAEVVVCGGVRRSALLSLSNLTDDRMRHAKDGQFWISNAQRALANNSVCYSEKPDLGSFLSEWSALYQSKSGERGIFSRYAMKNKIPERRELQDFGTNPCSEIILRSKQFCNLTEVVIRPTDGLQDLERKVEIATILGTIQATFTNFRYLSSKWKKNTEEERLLGVSLTGICDNPTTRNPSDTLKTWLNKLRTKCVEVNKEYANHLGIPVSAAITCVKPSGTVSQLVSCSSGIHEPFASYYVRRVRADQKDPLCQALTKAGVPYEVDINNPGAFVFSFYIDASERTPKHYKAHNAIEQLERWRFYDKYWCEHKPSCTIMVEEHEWLDVAAWVYKNFDDISGISFFPKDNHVYQQAPYEAISKEQIAELQKKVNFDSIDFNIGEESDVTTSSQELACVGNQCEII